MEYGSFLMKEEIRELIRPWFDGLAGHPVNLDQTFITTIDLMIVATRAPPLIGINPDRYQLGNYYTCHGCLRRTPKQKCNSTGRMSSLWNWCEGGHCNKLQIQLPSSVCPACYVRIDPSGVNTWRCRWCVMDDLPVPPRMFVLLPGNP